MTDLDKLEQLAKAATPGPWFLGYAAVHSAPLNDEYQRIEKTIPDDAPEDAYAVLPDTDVCSVPVVGGDTPTAQGGRDGHYIAAASPDIVLKLIAVARAAKAVDKAADPVPVGDTEAALASVRAISAAMRAIRQALVELESP